MSVEGRSGHAIVLGASISGLLAARVLSESFEKVTVFDRDDLPTGATGRKGVPQGEYAHGLLALGREILEELFPNLDSDLAAQGAVPADVQRDCLWVNDGRRMARAVSGLSAICVSRPALEAYIRQRVRALPNVELRSGHEAVGLVTDSTGHAVTGARILLRDGTEQRHDADLVVDATGRGNRGPTWLAEIGYDKPHEDQVDPKTGYATRDYRRTSEDVGFVASVVTASPANPYGAGAVAIEGDRWIVTLFGVGAGNAPPADDEGFLDFTRRLPSTHVHDLLSTAEPLGPAKRMRLPTSVWRRYERMTRLPDGFIAFGDAICSFNPVYGQGMTVAAAEAIALRDALREGRRGLPRRFFAKAAKLVDTPWNIAVSADLRYPEVVGKRSRMSGLLNAYVAKINIAAERHPDVGLAFLRVANLIAPPQALFAPRVLAKVLWAGRRRQPVNPPSAPVAPPSVGGA